MISVSEVFCKLILGFKETIYLIVGVGPLQFVVLLKIAVYYYIWS